MFGVWKRLFPCLSMSIRTKLSTTLTIIVATAVLYNFIRRRNDPIEEETLEDRNENPLPAMNDEALPGKRNTSCSHNAALYMNFALVTVTHFIIRFNTICMILYY
jgi:hypothetical protein